MLRWTLPSFNRSNKSCSVLRSTPEYHFISIHFFHSRKKFLITRAIISGRFGNSSPEFTRPSPPAHSLPVVRNESRTDYFGVLVYRSSCRYSLRAGRQVTTTSRQLDTKTRLLRQQYDMPTTSIFVLLSTTLTEQGHRHW
jgi:hypothetical protein